LGKEVKSRAPFGDDNRKGNGNDKGKDNGKGKGKDNGKCGDSSLRSE
jgi:hypothetical protein